MRSQAQRQMEDLQAFQVALHFTRNNLGRPCLCERKTALCCPRRAEHRRLQEPGSGRTHCRSHRHGVHKDNFAVCLGSCAVQVKLPLG